MKNPKKYTIDDLVRERERAMKIASDFMNKYLEEAKYKKEWQRIISESRAETCRNIINAISGRTALNIGESLESLITRYKI